MVQSLPQLFQSNSRDWNCFVGANIEFAAVILGTHSFVSLIVSKTSDLFDSRHFYYNGRFSVLNLCYTNLFLSYCSLRTYYLILRKFLNKMNSRKVNLTDTVCYVNYKTIGYGSVGVHEGIYAMTNK